MHHQPHQPPPATYQAPPPLNPAIPHLNRSPPQRVDTTSCRSFAKTEPRALDFAGVPPTPLFRTPLDSRIQTPHYPTQIGHPQCVDPTPRHLLAQTEPQALGFCWGAPNPLLRAPLDPRVPASKPHISHPNRPPPTGTNSDV